MVKLYWAPKTRSIRALWMLEETGVAYSRERIDRDRAPQDPAFLAASPIGKIPALTDGAAQLAESGAICAYLAERFPQADLAPVVGDPLRGRYFHWLFFAPACIEPAFPEQPVKNGMTARSAEWAEQDRVTGVLERALERGPWILGDRFSAADVMIGSDLIMGFEQLGVAPAQASLRAYLERCHDRPALQRALAIEADG